MVGGGRLYLQQLFVVLFSFIYFKVHAYSICEIYDQIMSLSKKIRYQWEESTLDQYSGLP